VSSHLSLQVNSIATAR